MNTIIAIALLISLTYPLVLEQLVHLSINGECTVKSPLHAGDKVILGIHVVNQSRRRMNDEQQIKSLSTTHNLPCNPICLALHVKIHLNDVMTGR